MVVEQVVPHITDAIQDWIERVAAVPVDDVSGSADVCVIELGGVVGIFLSSNEFRNFLRYLRLGTKFYQKSVKNSSGLGN